MKSHHLLCCLVLSLSTVAPTALPADELFPDKALEAAVRQEVYAKRHNAEPLTKEDVKNISQVKGKSKGIKSLAGLEHCKAVQQIDLEGNEIADLTPLAGLKLLQSINLADNKITSVAPLAELDKVQYLELSRNQIADIAPLAKMTNMRSLYLSGNKIAKVDVLKNLTKIWTLYLDGNPVKDLSVLGQLKWLSSLKLSHCGIEDISFISPLTELKHLDLEGNKLSNVAPLLEMAKKDDEKRFSPFWHIYLTGNPIKPDAPELVELAKLGARITIEPATAVVEGHALLKQEVGNWKATIKTWMGADGKADPKAKAQTSDGTETNRMLGDYWLVSDFKSDFGGMPFEGHSVTGYDAETKTYTGYWVDSLAPSAATSVGTYDAAAKTLTYKLKGTAPDGSPFEAKSVTVYEDADHRTFTMYDIVDGKEIRSMEITYERQK